MTCPEIEDAEIPGMPDLAAYLTHMLADIHDISARLRRVEAVVDEFAPLARQAKSSFVLRNALTRGRKNNG
jgi:hypothetical protein